MLFGKALSMVCIAYPTMMERNSSDLTDLDQHSSRTVSRLLSQDGNSPDTTASSNQSNNNVCFSCGILIHDRYIYKVMEENYHESCLRCYCCQCPLSSLKKCFARNGNIYCEQDHKALYGKRCRRCMTFLRPTDVVQRAHYMFYHVQCFNCFSCHDQFNVGDEFHILDGDVMCRNDFHTLCSFSIDDGRSDDHRKTPKRPRTILNAQQRKQFKSAFDKSSKPSRKVREQLASETGLSVRVVQVWFQNQRAKMKKIVKKETEPTSDIQKLDMESEGRSTEEIKTSDDEESILNLEQDEGERSITISFADPIQKLYNMTSSQIYFPYLS